MRLALLSCLCIAAVALALLSFGCSRPETSAQLHTGAPAFPCALNSTSTSLLSLSLIGSLVASTLEQFRCPLSALAAARTETSGQQPIDAAVGLPSSSFVLYLPLERKTHKMREHAEHKGHQQHSYHMHMRRWRRHMRDSEEGVAWSSAEIAEQLYEPLAEAKQELYMYDAQHDEVEAASSLNSVVTAAISKR